MVAHERSVHVCASNASTDENRGDQGQSMVHKNSGRLANQTIVCVTITYQRQQSGRKTCLAVHILY